MRLAAHGLSIRCDAKLLLALRALDTVNDPALSALIPVRAAAGERRWKDNFGCVVHGAIS